MQLTTAQRAALRTNILATPAAAALLDSGDLQALADFYNAAHSPAFYCWKTALSREEVYNTTTAESTTWSWTIYKNQPATEQNSWVQMFMGDRANMSQDNLRAGVAAIFTGAATAQRDHVLAVAKQTVSRLERLFAVGTGSLVSPAKFGFDGAGQLIQGTAPYTLFVGI